MFDLSWGSVRGMRNGGNGVQGGYMGLSWGVFTTEKVMSRVGWSLSAQLIFTIHQALNIAAKELAL